MSRRWGRFLAGLVTGLSNVHKRRHRPYTRLHAAQYLTQRQIVETQHGPLVFVVTHPREIPFIREFATREPETLRWIDSFLAPCQFWDIGANIGIYTAYAVLRPGVAVSAFEPAAANFAALCRNVDANGCADRVCAYCLAFADRTELGQLNLSDPAPGSVFNIFDGARDCFGAPIDVRARQATLGFSVDGFRELFDLPAPNYLKIDVDSVEEQILRGAVSTLRDPALHSVLIELEEADTSRNAQLIGLLEAAGFNLSFRSGGNGTGNVNAIFERHAKANATDKAKSDAPV